MLQLIQSIDRAIFLFLNGLHCDWLDPVFYYGTGILYWTPLFLILLYLLIRRYRWQTLYIFLFLALMITLSDQMAGIFKEWVARPRPTHEPGLTGVHTVYGYVGGQYGFYSSHASNTLALAVFLSILLQGMWRWFTPLILLWAFFMAYTRIYLGVHYPGDILAGWMAGGAIGCLAGTACHRFLRKRISMRQLFPVL